MPSMNMKNSSYNIHNDRHTFETVHHTISTGHECGWWSGSEEDYNLSLPLQSCVQFTANADLSNSLQVFDHPRQ